MIGDEDDLAAEDEDGPARGDEDAPQVNQISAPDDRKDVMVVDPSE